MKIAIIGAGSMGGAIAAALATHNPGIANRIVVANRSQEKLLKLQKGLPNLETTTDNIAAARGADIVILAVKPWVVPSVIDQLRPEIDPATQAIVSIAGGVSLGDLASMVNTDPLPQLLTVIPDTAISVGDGMTFIASDNARQETVDTVSRLFADMGQVAVIDEKLMPAATALSSCGIAYAMRYAEASLLAGIQLGFTPRQALSYVLQTMRGAVSLMQTAGSLPQEEIFKVTTPGGMTIRGLNALDRNGFTAAVIDATLEPLKK